MGLSIEGARFRAAPRVQQNKDHPQQLKEILGTETGFSAAFEDSVLSCA